MFQPIEYQDLKVGTKYKIGIFTGIFMKEMWITLDTTRTIHHLYLEFECVKTGHSPMWHKFFSPFTCFEAFVPQNPQWKMERRSVNILVRRLIGDDNFEW